MLGLRVVALTGRFDHTIAVTFDYEHIADRFSTGFPSTRLISASTSVVKLAPMLQTAKSGFAHPARWEVDPEEQVADAKKQDLDLFCFTERYSSSGRDMFCVWAPKDKLVGHGMEVTLRFSHWEAIGIERG
ncbi:unnamed protein product [Clonostachys rosea f. rosea IK726]|uniref:Uncharacterized protein n=1 Tax=Clonostachys rosea f. rosea IK726 TaxID=1349383 RepID=A0ACA9UT45_BIOOC|nr:unnamed protein product [Clonostachys rosea f. rosea IK726]